MNSDSIGKTVPPPPPVWATDEGTDQALDGVIVDLIANKKIYVPPFPTVAMQLSRLLADENYDTSALARVVSSDPSLAAEVLRCANSALFRSVAAVVSLPAAITRIGSKELVGIVLASSLGKQTEAAGPLLDLRRSIWRQSLTNAMLAQQFAPKRSLPPDEAFVCGLLHDFGKIITIICVEEIAKNNPEIHERSLDGWIRTVEKYHVELGLVMAARWNLPQLVSEVVSCHHDSGLSSASSRPMVDLIHACDDVIELLERNPTVTEEDVGKLESLLPAERTHLWGIMPRVPEMVAALSEVSAEGAVAVSTRKRAAELITPPKGSVLPTARYPAGIGVLSVTRSGEKPFTTSYISLQGLALEGKTELPVGKLAKLVLKLSEPLELWINVVRCEQTPAGFFIEGKVFGLGGVPKTRWEALVRDAGRGPAGA